MRTLPIFLFACLSFSLAHAQDDQPSGPEKAYQLARSKTTTPPYGLAKVQGLIDKVKTPDSEDFYTNGLTPEVYQKLSLREKFTYNMIFAESHWQNCDIIPIIPEVHKKIVAQLPDCFDESGWSERQTRFFEDNKDSVIALMSESIQRAGYVGLNYKNVIVDVNATSMIPIRRPAGGPGWYTTRRTKR